MLRSHIKSTEGLQGRKQLLRCSIRAGLGDQTPASPLPVRRSRAYWLTQRI
jgi:hypothetical protein